MAGGTCTRDGTKAHSGESGEDYQLLAATSDPDALMRLERGPAEGVLNARLSFPAQFITKYGQRRAQQLSRVASNHRVGRVTYSDLLADKTIKSNGGTARSILKQAPSFCTRRIRGPFQR